MESKTETCEEQAAMSATKWRLFQTAIDLFASRGFSNVSIRDIAAATQLNPASLYNHFPGKEAFLTEACKYCEEYCNAGLPKVEQLVGKISDCDPYEFWCKLHPEYDAETLDMITKIVLIAICERRHNQSARDLFSKLFIHIPRKYIGAVLEEMVKQDIIEPLDVDSFINLFSAIDFYSSARLGSEHEIDTKEWRKTHDLLFSLLHFKKKK